MIFDSIVCARIHPILVANRNPLLGTPPPTQRCRKSALLCIVGALFLVLAVTPWPYQAAWGLATSAATFREALKVACFVSHSSG